MVLSSRRLPSLLRVPASPVPRSPRYYEGATTSHPRIHGRLLVCFHCPRVPPWFVSAAALPEGRRSSSRPGLLVSRCPIRPARRTWTRTGSLRSSGDPSCASAPFPDPGRTDVPSPFSVTSMLPPLPIQRRLRRLLISGLTPAALAPAAIRFALRVATRAQGSLPASWLSLCREGIEPSESQRKVSARFHDRPPFLLS